MLTFIAAMGCSRRSPQPVPGAALATSGSIAVSPPTRTLAADRVAEASATQSGTAIPLVGLGILGDSTQDEYTALENDRPAAHRGRATDFLGSAAG